MTGTYAPNWDENQVLTWSGRWHIAIEPLAHNADTGWRHARCGAVGYTRDHVPKMVRRLHDIARGVKQAPLCKKCFK